MCTEVFPLISIVFFSYNQENFIEEAVLSVLNQSYPNLQIIISDDFSTDKTYELASKVVDDYDGIHNIILRQSHKNLGLGKHVEEVFSIAKGEYFVLAAGDDISYFDRVSKFFEFIKKDGFKYSAVFSNLMVLDAESNEKRKLFLSEPVFSRNIRDFKSGVPVWTVGASLVIHRDLYDKYGGFVSGTIQEDGVLAFRAILEKGIGYLNDVTVGYRHHDNNVSQGLSLKKRVDFMRKEHLLWDNWIKDSNSSKMTDPSLINTLDKGLKRSHRKSYFFSFKLLSYPYLYCRSKLSSLKRIF